MRKYFSTGGETGRGSPFNIFIISILCSIRGEPAVGGPFPAPPVIRRVEWQPAKGAAEGRRPLFWRGIDVHHQKILLHGIGCCPAGELPLPGNT